MKKLLFIIGCAVLLGFASCTNDFLEEEMVATITQDYLDTPVGTEAMVEGTYEVLRWEYQREFGPWLFHAGTDAELAEQQNENQYNPAVYTSATGADANKGEQISYLTGQVNTIGMYFRINNANRAIYNLREGVVDLGGDEHRQRLSEALFNRAYAYYMMVTQLGDVPLKTDYTTGLPATFYFPKASSEEIYRLLISDLRYCYDNLPSATKVGTTAERNNRITKGAAGHMLAKLYLQRAQGAEFRNSTEPHLKALYKGNVASDLDSCIYYATEVINSGDYELAADYQDLFKNERGAWPAEENREIILSASFGPLGKNSGFGMRFLSFFVASYTDASEAWGMSENAWAYGFRNRQFSYSDWGYDVFTDKMADSRFEKTFFLEYVPLLSTSATAGTDGPYHAYDSEENKTQAWTAGNAAYFNANILPAYDRASWGGRQAVAGEHKIGTGDLGLVFLENTKESALDLAAAKAQPYVLYPRWVKDGSKYYYRLNGLDDFTINSKGLDAGNERRPNTRKFNDLNREGINSPYGSRDVSIFRLAETYLIRAEACGRKGDFGLAIADINEVRGRAAYKTGETRAEVIARLYPGAETLSAPERQWPYTVSASKVDDMRVDATYWDGVSARSAAENYPPTAETDLERFVHFIYNELTREAIAELMLYEGIHHAGIQYERIQYRQQLGSSLRTNRWPVADNVSDNGQGQNGQGKGFFQPFHTFRPWPQSYILLLTDENGTLLNQAGRQAYQNPGYN
jgi:hypothetical protein